jgi:hypothetical protein
MQIEKEVSDAVFSGARISLLAHTGKRIEVEGSSVQARWSEAGLWQTFTIQNYGGRAIFSGDAVFLKAHTGMMVDVQDTDVQARWQAWGDLQRFFIQKKDGSGAVVPGDRVVLQAHTGKMLDVQGHAVAANWHDAGDWQTFTLEKGVEPSASRRLFEAASSAFMGVSLQHPQQTKPVLIAWRAAFAAALLLTFVLLIAVSGALLGCCYRPGRTLSKVEPF